MHPRTPLVLLTSLFAAACTTQVVDRAADGPTPAAEAGAVVGGAEVSSVAPTLSVERFLQAVNVEDLDAMGRVFGTARGPAEGEPLQLERELALISRILRHEDYQIVSDRREFGREHRTHRIGVNLTINGRVIRDVGFSVVQAPDGRWFVEVIELEKVTGA
ncbi:MAG: hypothetical protein RQ745_11665 [Longimicrobiales bacterium]|nr:hypothetical protein [Longimicrobiales bacterium]